MALVGAGRWSGEWRPPPQHMEQTRLMMMDGVRYAITWWVTLGAIWVYHSRLPGELRSVSEHLFVNPPVAMDASRYGEVSDIRSPITTE